MMSDVAGVFNLKPDVQRSERQGVNQGTKRKLLLDGSGPDDEAEPRCCSTSDICISPQHESAPSTAGRAQQDLLTPPSVFSSASNIVTSATSHDAPTRHLSHMISTAAAADDNVSDVGIEKAVNKSARQKVSSHILAPEGTLVPVRVGNRYICACCPKTPKVFDTEEQLKEHRDEKRYLCHFCERRFKNKNEAERHEASLHIRKHSWACSALEDWKPAFGPLDNSRTIHLSADACGYCGEEFSNHPAPHWGLRLQHLIEVHKYGECDGARRFYRADHFRQHLKHSHAGKSGKWTNILEGACIREAESGSR